MKFLEFELLIDTLSNQEKYDEVDKLLDDKINEICELPCEEVEKYLELYASIAGDAESLERFDRLFNKLLTVNKVKSTDIKRYEKISPANRWL